MSHQKIIWNWTILNVFIKLVPMEMGIAYMPTMEVHQDKQNRTQLALSDLQQSQNRPQHGDWIVTLAFYKALHVVDSYFAKQGIDRTGHDKRHKQRKKQVQDHLGCIHGKYSALYEASIQARYEAYTHDSQEVATLVDHSVFIEEHIKTLLEFP